MPSLEDSISNVTAFYANHAPYFHETAYGNSRSEAKHLRLRKHYQEAFANQSVLELAAGSGYWTEAVASTAKQILATDVHANLIEVIRKRLQHLPNVQCQVADAYALDGIAGHFTAAFAQYWLSHVPRKRVTAFLANLHSKLQPGALVIFSDDLKYEFDYVTRRVDEHGDIQETFHDNPAIPGERIKNFPTREELLALVADVSEDTQYHEYEAEHLWVLSYRLRRSI